jgi:cell division protein FtsW (lipid II flippase)
MFTPLLYLHSAIRWLLLAGLLLSIFRAAAGYIAGKPFGKTDNLLRHWTATFSHIQLVLGITLYSQSVLVKYYWQHRSEADMTDETWFFAVLHIVLMLLGIVLITVGSSLAKRRTNDKQKYGTVLVWYSISLLLILVAIPWPFSPWAHRPLFRL